MIKPDTQQLDVLTFGESLGLFSAVRDGALMHGSDLTLSFGGAESNVAIGLARLGARAGWVGAVGEDAMGAMIQRELRAEGVHAFAVVSPRATSAMIKHNPYAGRTAVTYYRAGMAGSDVDAGTIDPELVHRARLVHVTGITAALGDGPWEALQRIVTLAGAAGIPVSFDINHRLSLWSDVSLASSRYRWVAERAHIVFGGPEEIDLITSAGGVQEQVRELVDAGVGTVVVKDGERGARAFSADGSYVQGDALKVTVVDTVGAGDAFVAGWLAEHSLGAPLQECLETALACGAAACRGRGDWESNATRAEIEMLRSGDADPVSR